MPLADEVRDLKDQIQARLDEARDFYLHTGQAWRAVQKIAYKGRDVGIVDTVSGQKVPAADLEPLAQQYMSVHLAQSAFRGLSRLLEDWICGLARLWLSAYPKQLDAAYREAANQPRSQRQEEIKVPLSEILGAPDIATVLGHVVERIVRDLAYQRPDQWFRFLDKRVKLGCPDDAQRSALCEMKAARDVLEHNRGVVGHDYLEKAGAAARFVEGEVVQIDEPYLLDRFSLLRKVIDAMATEAIRKSSGST